MAELRVFHNHRFLCRAICAELAGGTIALREIIQARTHRRKALRPTLQDRARTVEALLEAHRGDHAVEWSPPPIPEEALPPSNGQTEGQVTRLKLLKRQRYGRAKLDRLRQRV